MIVIPPNDYHKLVMDINIEWLIRERVHRIRDGVKQRWSTQPQSKFRQRSTDNRQTTTKFQLFTVYVCISFSTKYQSLQIVRVFRLSRLSFCNAYRAELVVGNKTYVETSIGPGKRNKHADSIVRAMLDFRVDPEIVLPPHDADV